MTEAERKALALTKAQREYITQGGDGRAMQTRLALWRRGIVSYQTGNLTDLGLAVRQHLKEQTDV